MSRACLGCLALLVAISACCPATAPGGENYAFLVAVASYPERSGLGPLSFTERDIDRLEEVLSAGGYPEGNIVKLSHGAAAEDPRFNPLAENIRDELSLLLAELRPADTVVVALSGHGVQYKGEKDLFFCPFDVQVQSRRNLLSLDEIYGMLNECQAASRLLLVDACRADPGKGSGEAGLAAKGERTLGEEPPRGIAAFFSCSQGESSYESSKLQHGLFFNYVISGLAGEADLDGDGEITLPELELHAIRNVQRQARREVRVKQTPERRGQSEGLMTLARLTPRPVEPDPDPNPAPAEEPALLVAPFTAAQARGAREAWAARLGVPAERTEGAGIDLLLIPPGEFLMGSPEGEEDSRTYERPQHRVRIGQPFYLGKTEVTQKAWRAVMNTQPWTGQVYVQEGDDYPAIYVSWEDAAEFCRRVSERERLTYRLPTEAEWEYAARAGMTTAFYFGESEASLGTYAWYVGNARDADEKYAHRVGLKRANPFGLHDLHGNVWEWCSDRFDSDYYASLGGGLAVDPTGPASGSSRVLRGGGWNGAPGYCRSAHRNGYSPGSRISSLGFRVAAVTSGEQ